MDEELKRANERLVEAQQTHSTATFLATVVKAAVDQAQEMGSDGPIEIRGSFEGNPFAAVIPLKNESVSTEQVR